MIHIDPFYKLLEKEQKYIPLDKDTSFKLKLFI